MAFSPETVLAFIALSIVALVFIGFLLETHPPATTAVAGVAMLLGTGALSTQSMLSVFSNPAPATIAALFVVSGALARVGALDILSRSLRRSAVKRPWLTIAALIIGAMTLSAFVNNTPVVMVLIPVTISVASALKLAPSRLLIPLSYATILGGMCTLIGTSTNLLVDGVAQSHGLEPIGIFEMTPFGLAAAAVGAIYMAALGPVLLPNHLTVAGVDGRKRSRFMLEGVVGRGSSLIGSKLSNTHLFADNSIRVTDVIRGSTSLRHELKQVELQEGDRLVLRTEAEDLNDLRDDGALHLKDDSFEPYFSRRSTLLEVLVGPGCQLLGKRLRKMRLRRAYNVYAIAAHRRGANMKANFEQLPIEVGDTILFEGAPEDLKRMSDDLGLIALSNPPERNFRPEKAPIALAALLGVTGLAAFGAAPIAALAVIAVAIVLITRCVDADEALQSVDGSLLVLIYSMLAIGQALHETGAVRLMVEAAAPTLSTLPIPLLLAGVYLLTSLMTELITNNAVAVVLAPVVIELGAQLGIDPRPLVLLIMIAASASFATPIGYQTNTLVYGAGGYRFTDFIKMGAPLNLLIGGVTTVLIWLVYFQ